MSFFNIDLIKRLIALLITLNVVGTWSKYAPFLFIDDPIRLTAATIAVYSFTLILVIAIMSQSTDDSNRPPSNKGPRRPA